MSKLRRFSTVIATTVVWVSVLFVGAPGSVADPYDDDGGGSGSSYDTGGYEQVDGGTADPDGPGDNGTIDPDNPGEPGDNGTIDPDQPGDNGTIDPDQPGAEEISAEAAQAPQDDVLKAETSQVISATSSVATSEQISSYQASVQSALSGATLTAGLSLTSPVVQWNSGWLSYDSFYRPVLMNPYRTPMDVVYDYGGQTRVVTIPPLQRAALDVADPGVYSFTAMTRTAAGPATNLSVGSFSGGGYQPAPGQAPPRKPAKLDTSKNALVQVKFARGTSEPFRVKSLVDLGPDAGLNGATKVLLDGEIPAWGRWTQTQEGAKLFQITETQLLPGVNPPAQDPLPGYKVQLASSEKAASWINEHQTALIIAAVGAGVLALAAVGLIVRRRHRGAH